MIGKCRILFTLLLICFVSGCAIITVPLLPGPQPLKEQGIEGKGTPKILIVDVSGVISEKNKEGMLLGGATPSPVVQIHEALQAADADRDVAGVIIRINSPGGTIAASDIIHHDIVRFKSHRKVPVYACITGVGASGGYYVATAADEITAHPTAVTGSIGVILMTVNVEGLMSKIGVSELTIKSGDKKDIMSPFRTATPEEKKLMQTVVDQMYRRFVDTVVARPGNTLSRKEVETLADGRIYTAEQARDAKLIDRVEYLDEVIARMKEKLGLKEARIVTYYHAGQYKGTIYSGAAAESSGLAGLLTGGTQIDWLGEIQFMYLWKPF